MKKIKMMAVLLLLVSPFLVFAQSGDFVIEGTAAPASKIVKVFLFDDGKADSSMVVNGHFRFSGHITEPHEVLIFSSTVADGFWNAAKRTFPVNIYKEPGTIKVEVRDSTGQNLIFSGGKTNAELNEYNKVIAEVKKEAITVFRALGTASKEDAVALEKRRSELFEQESLLTIAFAKKHPDSYVSVDRLFNPVRTNASIERVMTIGKVVEQFDPQIKNSKSGKDLQAVIARIKGSTIGGQANDFSNLDSLGHAVALHDLKGKYVLIDFWASWCVPCRAENPNVVKAYNKYKEKNFTVLAISLDNATARDKWLKAIAHDQMPYMHVNDPNGETAKLYSIISIPRNFLVDPQGKIIATDLRGQALQDKLAELFDNQHN